MPADYSTLTTAGLAEILGLVEPTVRKNISLARRSLTEQFRDKLNVSLGEDDVIENRPPSGYRLSPHPSSTRVAVGTSAPDKCRHAATKSGVAANRGSAALSFLPFFS